MRGASRICPTLLLAYGALALAACATSTRVGNEAWRSGRWTDAAYAYESARTAAVEPRDADRLLLRLGLIYLEPATPMYDETRARERLGELVTRHPDSPYRGEAQVILELLDARDDAERRLGALREQVGSLADERASAAAGLKTRDATIAALRASLAETQAELARAREALEQLKRIDLQRRP